MITEEFQKYFKAPTLPVHQSSTPCWVIWTLVHRSSPHRAVKCPHCESKKTRSNGKLKGIQRYLCNGCGKNFSETTGKVWYNLKKKDKMNR